MRVNTADDPFTSDKNLVPSSPEFCRLVYAVRATRGALPRISSLFILSCICRSLSVLQLKDVVHENLNVFAGACIDPPNLCLLWHYCSKGSLNVSMRRHDSLICECIYV